MTTGVELATAYVSLTVSARGIGKSIADALDRPAEQAARDAGAAIDRIVTKAVGDIHLALPSIDVPKLGDIAAPAIGVPQIPQPAAVDLKTLAAPKIGVPEIPLPATPRLPTLRAPEIERPEIPEPDDSGFKAALAAAGVGGGAALVAGFLSSTSAEVSNDKLAARLGINDPSFAKDLGKAAADVYKQNFGDSLGEVNAGIRSVLQQGLVPEDATNSQIERISKKALGLGDVFEQDLGGVAAATGQLIKTGLSKNADQAIDVIVRGFQQGADKSGDLLDTLNEYPTQFRQLGLSAGDAVGILLQGLKAGARDSDVVGDALKEFALKAVEGAGPARDALTSLGVDATKLAAAVAAGGPAAKAGLTEVLDRLRAVQDPLKRTQASFALFGTQAEDTQAALLALDPKTAVRGLGDVAGAADKMNAIVGSNSASAFESFKRTAEVNLAGVTGALGPVVSGVLDIGPALGGLVLTGKALAGPLKAVGSGIFSIGKSAVVATGRVIAQTASFVAQKVAAAASAIATKAMAAAQWLLNAAMEANPIVLVVAAIVALVAVLVLAYKHSKAFREIVQAAFGAAVDAAQAAGRVVSSVVDIIVGAFSSVVSWLRGNWDIVLTILTGPFGAVILIARRFGDDIVGFFTKLPGRIAGAAGDVFGWLRDQVAAAATWVGARVGDIVGFVTGLPRRLVAGAGDVSGWLRTGASEAKDWVGGRIGDLVGLFTGLPKRFKDAAGDMFGWIRDLFKAAINGVLNIWNNLKFPSFEIGGWDPPGPIPRLPSFHTPPINFPNIPLLHDGGTVPGPRGADVLAILQAGERVIPNAPAPAWAGGGHGFSVEGGINVTTQREEDTATVIVNSLKSLAYLMGG